MRFWQVQIVGMIWEHRNQMECCYHTSYELESRMYRILILDHLEGEDYECPMLLDQPPMYCYHNADV